MNVYMYECLYAWMYVCMYDICICKTWWLYMTWWNKIGPVRWEVDWHHSTTTRQPSLEIILLEMNRASVGVKPSMMYQLMVKLTPLGEKARQSSGVISHANNTQECSWYVTMIVPRPILCFHQVWVRTYLTIHVKKGERRMRTYIQVFPSFIFCFW